MLKFLARFTLTSFAALLFVLNICAQTQTTGYLIETVAGSEPPRDAALGVDTWLDFPFGVAADDAGNVYVSDAGNFRVLRIHPDGTRETVVGTGQFGFSGDGGPATEAKVSSPRGLAVGPDGSLYLTDTSTRRIRKVAPDGIITTVAGSGQMGYSGDGGPALDAAMNSPTGVALDPIGNIYIADTDNHCIRKVDAQGMISTIAGTGEAGFSGDDGPATEAQLARPQGVAIGPGGEVYIADSTNSRIRVIDTEGMIDTLAGGGNTTNTAVAADYSLGYPNGVAVDSKGTVYIANQFGNDILSVTGPLIQRIAGTGAAGFGGDGGPAVVAVLNNPQHIAVAETGGKTSVYFADTANDRVRKVAGGAISTVVGTAHLAGDGGPATEALLDGPADVSLDADGNLYIAEAGNNVVRKVAADGTISTFAGTGVQGSGPLGLATETELNAPRGVLARRAGDVLIANRQPPRVLRVGPAGQVSAFAGTGSNGFDGDGGQADEAKLWFPSGLAEGSDGSVYIADSSNNRIRRVGPDGVINTVAGNGERAFSGDGGAAVAAAVSRPADIDVDSENNLFIADTGNRRIRQVTPGGVIDTLAGGGSTFVGTNDVPALEASLAGADGVVIRPTTSKGGTAAPDLFVSSFGRVYLATGAGSVRTIAGGTSDLLGDGGPATEADLESAAGMATDADGNIYVADTNHHRVRKLTPVTTRIGTGGVVNAAAIAFSVAVDTVSPDTIVSIFGIGLSAAAGDATTLPLPTELAGVRVDVVDSAGRAWRASLFAVRSTQINCLIPAEVAFGPATLTVTTSLGTISTIDIAVVAVAPGLFAIDGSGGGLAAASAFRRDADGVDTPLSVFTAELPFEPVPLDLGAETDLVVLSLFGTGIRGSFGQITATIGGVEAQVLGFAPSGQFAGLDQVNLLVPRSLIGAGVVEIQITVDGLMLNPVTVTIL